ncbi:hypothetical protein QJQ45_017961, partial [Haematococcus lacustris]
VAALTACPAAAAHMAPHGVAVHGAAQAAGGQSGVAVGEQGRTGEEGVEGKQQDEQEEEEEEQGCEEEEEEEGEGGQQVAPSCPAVHHVSCSPKGSLVCVVVEGEQEVQVLRLLSQPHQLQLLQRLCLPGLHYPCASSWDSQGRCWVVGGPPLDSSQALHLAAFTVNQGSPSLPPCLPGCAPSEGRVEVVTPSCVTESELAAMEQRQGAEEALVQQGGLEVQWTLPLQRRRYEEHEKEEHMKKRNDLKEHKRLEEIRKKKSETKNGPKPATSSLAVAEFDPAAQMGMRLDPGAILAVSAASGMCDEDGCLESFYQAPRNSRRWNDNVKLELQHLAAATPAGTSLVAIQRHVAVTLATWDAVCGEYPHPKWAEQKVRLNGVQEKVLERYFKKLEEEAADISQQRCKQLVVFFGNVGIGVRGGSRAKAVLWACHKVVERPTSGILTDRLPGKVVTVNEFCTSRVSSAMSTPQPCEDELDRSELTRPRGGTGKEYQALGFKKLRYRAPAACSTSLLLDAMTEDTEASDIDWLSLPPELLGNIVARVCRLREDGRCMERRSLQQSCKALKQAVLLYWPQLTILLNKPPNPLNPPPLVSDNLVRKMQARQAKLEVVLWYQHQLCTKANADDCITEVLQSLPLCGAVERLSLQYDTDKRGPTSHLSWPDARTQLLRDRFPSLTALSVSGFLLWSDTLTGLVDASQQLGLHQLHVTRCKKAFGRIDFDDVFSGCRLQQLSLDIWWRAVQLPSLQQLAPHLTHLTLALPPRYESVQDCLPLLQGLSQLRVLNLTKPEPHPPPCNSSDEEYYEPSTEEEEEEEDQDYELGFSGLPQLVKSLPSLHSLHLPPLCLQDQDMEALLAITQLTRIQPLFQSQLSHSYADAACSWRHLEWDDEFLSEHSALQTLAHLPLHSLTHPLHIPELLVDASHSDLDLATAAIENLVNRCKAPVSIGFLTLRCPTGPNAACTDGGVQLAVVEALVAQLQPIAIQAMKVMGLLAVTPSTVRALAPACRAASRVILQGGPMAPGLE